MQMWVASFTKTVYMTGEDEVCAVTEPILVLQNADSACFSSFEMEGDRATKLTDVAKVDCL